ncbi:MAG: hypothetical protein J4428_00010 [Candidatus Aenigmarchaeota archaeon]|nr:hypothetical protein [Candidatus Aenigmarchaeota archaeon]
MEVDKKEQYTTVRIKKSTKKDLEVLKGMLAIKYPDQAPFDLDDAIELIEREYFGIMISKHPEMKRLFKRD